jgi:hypothetical protein
MGIQVCDSYHSKNVIFSTISVLAGLSLLCGRGSTSRCTNISSRDVLFSYTCHPRGHQQSKGGVSQILVLFSRIKPIALTCQSRVSGDNKSVTDIYLLPFHLIMDNKVGGNPATGGYEAASYYFYSRKPFRKCWCS